MPTFMHADDCLVQPNCRPVIDRSEVQQDPLPSPIGRDGKGSPIPDTRMKTAIANAAHSSLRREGHENRQRKIHCGREPSLVEPDFLMIDAKLPRTIQIQPFLANELRSRIFGTREWGNISSRALGALRVFC
jgi:hypothetical protein